MCITYSYESQSWNEFKCVIIGTQQEEIDIVFRSRMATEEEERFIESTVALSTVACEARLNEKVS